MDDRRVGPDALKPFATIRMPGTRSIEGPPVDLPNGGVRLWDFLSRRRPASSRTVRNN
jgi:hypothetical protein